MIKFIFLMTVLQHLRHANEVTCFMSFEAHLHITQVTFIQEIMFFFLEFISQYEPGNAR